MNKDNNQQILINNAILAGINLLSSEDVKIPTKDLEVIANLKGLLQAFASGDLVIVTPDKVKDFEEQEVPKEET